MAGREALGAGDKYLLAMVGATLGWRPLLGVILLSSLQGALYGLTRRALTGRAGPPVPPTPESTEPVSLDAASPSEAVDAPTRDPWTPAFLRAGLPLWRRALLLPYALLLQDIPDPPPPDEQGEEPEWVPGTSNMPFGPWIGLGGLEVLLVGPWIAWSLHGTTWGLSAEILFGG
jgi:leader peptidase (prepilin peptidase)/N-methyltransferase